MSFFADLLSVAVVVGFVVIQKYYYHGNVKSHFSSLCDWHNSLFNVFVGSGVNLSSFTGRCSGTEFYICKSEVNRDHTTRCTKCCMPLKLTSKCHANTFVKVDAQIKKSADGLSPIWKGITIVTQSSVDWLLKHTGKLTFPAVSKMCNVTSCPSMSTLCWYQLSVNKILIKLVFKNLRSSALRWRFSLFSALRNLVFLRR